MSKSLMSAIIRIRPDIAGFKSETMAGVRRVGADMEDELEDAGRRAGDAAGDGIKDGVKDGARSGAKAAESELGAAAKRVGDKFGKLQGVGAKMTLGITAPLVLLGKTSFDVAANVADLQGAVGVTFGEESAAVIDGWAETLAKTSGISKQAGLDAALTFGTFGKAAGLAGEDLATYAMDLTKLAGDMASFRGTSTEEAITAIGAALRGETEPIRRYGVMLDDATMRAKALEMGLIQSTKQALDPQQKSLAATALIFERTQDAQGDFVRTADSAANTVRSQRAEFENLQAELGKELIPVMKDLLGVTRDIVGWFSGLSEGEKRFLLIGAAVAAIAGPMLTVIATIGQVGAALVGLAARWGGVTAAANVAAGAQARAAGAGMLAGKGAIGAAGAGLAGAAGTVAAGAAAAAGGYAIGSWLNNTFGISETLGNAINGLAEGGTVTRGGLTWVGERGPELLQLPRGSEVRPLDKVGGIHISGPITVVASDPREFVKQLDRAARRGAATTGTRRLP